jgi:branched-chain amino acid transport system substrate-binding protein
MPGVGRTLAPVVLAGILTGCSGKAPPETVYIGHLAPRSGPDREVGEQAEHGIALAVEEANEAEGLVAGRKVVVLHPDSRGDPEVLQSEAVRLVTVSKAVALLGGTDADSGERLARIAQQYSVPLVTPAGLPPRAISAFAFPTGLAPADHGRALGRFVADELKAPRVAVVAAGRRLADVAVAAAFAEELRKGGQVRVAESAYQKAEELKDLARQVVSGKPAAVFVAGTGADFAKLRTELRAAGLPADVPLVFGGEEVAARALRADAEAANGVSLATAFVADESLPRAQEFSRRYVERFGRPPEVFAALAYDDARLLFDAMRRPKSVQGSKVRDELAKVKDFESLTGPLTLDKDRGGRRTAFVVRLEDGRERLLKRYPPSEK